MWLRLDFLVQAHSKMSAQASLELYCVALDESVHARVSFAGMVLRKGCDGVRLDNPSGVDQSPRRSGRGAFGGRRACVSEKSKDSVAIAHDLDVVG